MLDASHLCKLHLTNPTGTGLNSTYSQIGILYSLFDNTISKKKYAHAVTFLTWISEVPGSDFSAISDILANVSHVFLSPLRQIHKPYRNYGTNTSFQIISNSTLTHHPAILYYNLKYRQRRKIKKSCTFTLEQAMKAQMGIKDIGILFL